MKIYYNSGLAKVLTFLNGFATMMLFGFVITEHSSLNGRCIKHEWCHVQQYKDCVGLGLGIGILVTFILFAFEIQSWWILLLILVPFTLYYIIYLVEWLYWIIKEGVDKAYRKVGFERQAYWIQETWDKPCSLQRQYETFGWWKRLS